VNERPGSDRTRALAVGVGRIPFGACGFRTESGPDLLRVGMAEVIEDGQGSPPSALRGRGIADRVLGVAEVDDGVGLAGAAAEVPVQGERILVVGDGLGVPPEMVVGVAEAVRRGGLTVAVPDGLHELHGLLAVGQRCQVVAGHGVVPPDRVEGAALAFKVIRGAVQVERALGAGDRVVEPLLPFAEPAVDEMGVGFAGAVLQVSAQVQCPVEERAGLLGASELAVRLGERSAHADFGSGVVESQGGLQGRLPDGRLLLPGTAIEMVPEGPGQLPAVGVEAVLGRQSDRGRQGRALGREPRHGGLAVGQVEGRDVGGRVGEGDRVPVRVGQAACGVGGVQVEVEQSPCRLLPLLLRVDGLGELGGVRPQEVVEGEAAEGRFVEQVAAGQLDEEPIRQGRGDACDGCGGRRRDLGTGVGAEEPEQACRVGGEGAVRPGEDGAEVEGRVGVGECVEAVVGVVERRGQGGQREVGPRGRPCGHNGQCEGESVAGFDDPLGGFGFGGRSPAADAALEQPLRVLGAEARQGDRDGAVGDQAGEAVAAGDQHEARGGAGQERADLVEVACVVEDHEDPLVRQQTAVQGGLRVQIARHTHRRRLQRFEEVPDGLAGLERLPDGIESAQVDVQLAVGEAVGDAVRPVDRERGLPDPGGAGDDRGCRRSGRLDRGGEQFIQ
jgi:hypothetical protein